MVCNYYSYTRNSSAVRAAPLCAREVHRALLRGVADAHGLLPAREAHQARHQLIVGLEGDASRSSSKEGRVPALSKTGQAASTTTTAPHCTRISFVILRLWYRVLSRCILQCVQSCACSSRRRACRPRKLPFLVHAGGFPSLARPCRRPSGAACRGWSPGHRRRRSPRRGAPPRP